MMKLSDVKNQSLILILKNISEKKMFILFLLVRLG